MPNILENDTKQDELIEQNSLKGNPGDISINPKIIGTYFQVFPNGDFILGNYNGGAGVYWNQLSQTFTVLGSINVSSINIPDTTTANSFHVDSDGNTWWGSTTFASAIASISKAGDAIFNSVTTIALSEIVLATNFEATGRFTLGGNLPTFGTNGAAMATAATANSLSQVLWNISQQGAFAAYGGSPKFNCSINTFVIANSGMIFVGIGMPTSGGTFLNTANHIGFKILITGGVASLYGTHADGVTEQATAALTTLANTDSLDLIAIVNSTTSVDYYWRKNGGAISAKTTATGNVPTANENQVGFFADNQSNANVVSCKVSGATYRR